MKKKFAFLLGFTLLGAAGFSQSADSVLMTINGEEITKSEFEYVYNKNNSNASVEKKSVDEYIDLFVNFKLKVAEAKAQKLDETQNFKDEFKNYREQLAAPYFIEEDLEHALIEEAFQRSKESLSASHILVKKRGDGYIDMNKVAEIQKRLDSGEKFEKVAVEMSDCPSSDQGGYLGYINVFDMVYPFECAAYATPVGTYSKPVKSSHGYHFIMVHHRRPNISKIKISHIFLTNSVAANSAKRDSLLQLIKKNGADFISLAEKNSSVINKKDGHQFWVNKGLFPPEFEEAVFDMKKGEVKGVNSAMGYHIVRCDSTSLDCSLDKNTTENIKDRISKNDRSAVLASRIIERKKEQYGYEYYPEALKPYLEAFKMPEPNDRDEFLDKYDEPVFTLKGETFSQKDFTPSYQASMWKYYMLKNGQGNRSDLINFDISLSDKEYVEFALNRYVKLRIMDREYDRLYNSNPEYRNLLNEYKDGLLLFDISQREVWGKSARDAVKLTEFFEANKEKYSFSEPKFRGSVIYCKNEKIKKKAEKLLAKGMSAEDVVNELKEDFKKEEKPAYLKVGLFAKGNNEAVDANIFKSAEYKSEKYPFVVLTGSLTNTPENYREVKGPVTADYQNQLEIEWVKSLREKYPVVINQDVLDSIKNK